MSIAKRFGTKFLSLALCLVMLTSLVTPALAKSISAPAVQTEENFKTSSNWIWSSEETVNHRTAYFRKEVTLDSVPKKINVETSAHNHLKYYVNGNLVTGYVSPANASLPENVNYLSYTWEGAELDALLGENKTRLCLAAAAQFIGEAKSSNYVTGKPGFWTEVTVTYENGETETIKSDTSWRTSDSTPFADTKAMFEKHGLGSQIDYDARKMPDGLAWTRFGFDESQYPEVTWKNAVLADRETATWKMRLQNVPEGAVHKELTPLAMGKQEIGHQVFDATQLVTGWVKIRASAPAGTRIYIRYSEYLNKDGTVHLGVGSSQQTTEDYRDFYTFSGNGVETFVADFDYKAFRYFEIVGLSDWIQVEDISVQWASSDLTQVSTFTSSDDMLNKLYEACINTQINNTIGMTVDCPHREQAQYLADSQLQYALFSYAFEEAPEFIYKTLFDFATQQLENGRFEYTSPTSQYVAPDIYSIPEWDLRYTAILHRYYELTGNLAAVAEFYDNAAANVNFHYAMVDSTGLLIDDPAGRNISDHPGKGVKDNPGFPPTVVNLLLYDSLNRLSRLASLLGKDTESAAWAEKASALKQNINVLLKDNETGLYKHHLGTNDTNIGVTAMAINVGVAEKGDLQKQLEAISLWTNASTANAETSVVLTYELLCAIMQYGTNAQKEYLYKRMEASWGQMVKKGHKTTWERWEDSSSHSHAWSAYPAYIMLRGFAGINFNGTAYSDITVKPFLPTGISHVSSTVKIPDSNESITVRLEREAGYKLVVKPPKGESVTVAVPRAEGGVSLITANGKTVFRDGKGLNVSGLTYLNDDAEYVYFKTTANKTYTFKSSVAPLSDAESFTLNLNANPGGSVLLNGETVSLPYSEPFAAGSEITLQAVPANRFAFLGWSGSLGETEETLSITLNANLDLKAVFEERVALKVNTVTVTGPEGAGWSVSYEGVNRTLPTTLNVIEGTEIKLTLVEPDLSSHSFISWSGASTSTEKEITLTVNANLTLSAIGSIKTGGEPQNLALGKTVTATTANTTTWAAANLTDGKQGHVSGSYGLSSPALTSNTLPHVITIDLAETVSFNKVIIYPRTDYVDASGQLSGFPASYYIEVSADNATWEKVHTVENAEIPMATEGPIEITFAPVKARYFRFVTVAPGNPDDKGKNKYTQLQELEIYNTNPPESVTLTVDGSGQVQIDGEIKTLPFSGSFAGGTVVSLKPVVSDGFVFSGWTGGLTSSADPLYITLNEDFSVTANYLDPSKINLALGKEVLTSHATANTGAWGADNLTDGVNKDGGSSNHGISTVILSEGETPWFTIDFGAVTEFNKIVIYPRYNKYDADGTIRCFPAKWSLMISNDNAADASQWTEIYADKDAAIHKKDESPIVIELSSPVSAQYLRFACHELGLRDKDEADGGNLHVQLFELEVYNVPTASAAVLSTDTEQNGGGSEEEARLSVVSADFEKNVSASVKMAQKPADKTHSYAYLWVLLPIALLTVGITLKKKVFFK
ncbi:MAG: family 78 glycoside hydrolase catalytic domain [Clostridia bacterium]|nr:family 78 glycoside hydrolase catalytic domain [Clostridia bacterium]